jgi:hypothetical protein
MDSTEEMVFAGGYAKRERSHTPPMFSYPSYPAPDELLLDSYASAQPYPSISAADPYPNYMTAAVPSTLPSMANFADPMKPCEENLNPYLNYNFVPAVDINITGHYESSSASAHVSFATQHFPVYLDAHC